MSFSCEGRAQEPVYGTHIINYHSFLKGCLKSFFLEGIGGIENTKSSKYIPTGGKEFVLSLSLIVPESRHGSCLKTYVTKSSGEHVVPVVGAAAEPIESLVKELVFIILVSWVTDWGAYHGEFIFK